MNSSLYGRRGKRGKKLAEEQTDNDQSNELVEDLSDSELEMEAVGVRWSSTAEPSHKFDVRERYRDEPMEFIERDTNRNLRKVVVYGILGLFFFVAVSSFGILIAYGAGKLPQLPPSTINWLFGTICGDIVGALVFGWKAAAGYLFKTTNPEDT